MNGSMNLMLVSILARMLEGRNHVLIGTNSAAPASAALLARALSGGRMRVTIIGSTKYNFLTDDFSEVFDSATRGIYDGFFIGGGQIDGQANINLVGVGDYPSLKVRWPGSHGTPLLYMMIPNAIILLRQEHSRRSLVPKVDFISTPGVSEPGVYRPGGPTALVTELCVFKFWRERGRFELQSVHPGVSVDEVKERTGFDFDIAERVVETVGSSEEMLRLLRDRISAEVGELYPQFAAALAKDADQALRALGAGAKVAAAG
jgi:glutaconate CoA-transferase subunit B